VPLTSRQNELLHFAGTVRLPSPHPATGTLSIIAFDGRTYAPERTILRLTHRVSDRLDVSRLFRLSDVKAIHADWPSDQVEAAQAAHPIVSELKLADEIVALVRKYVTANPGGSLRLKKALVYLPESAPVILQVEAAQSAAESAEYYPPMARGAGRESFLCEGAGPHHGEPKWSPRREDGMMCDGDDAEGRDR
jgi:hypothetical protein